MKIIIVGGGWAGCAAAFAARRAGAEVLLVEKTDMLLGTGLVGGIMCNNGRFTALEEARAMGGADFIAVIESVTRHRALDFPGHKHAMLYDVTKIEPAIRNFLTGCGVDIKLQTRLTEVFAKDGFINGIVTANNEMLRGDAFIDTTGSAGPAKYCTRYGTGCAMCILRCPTFGPRVSLTSRAGLREIRAGEGMPQFEAMSGSCKLEKNSLAPEIVRELERKGFLVIPLPPGLYKDKLLDGKACQQYALKEYARNLIILDTGHAKIMTPYFPLETLRTLPGFANARYADPYSGGRGNSVRFNAMAHCNDALQVEGMSNLFCAGEKTGPLVGHTEAMVTGFLAGRNAVLLLSGKKTMVLPETTAVGDIIGFMHRAIKQPEGLARKYTFSGSVYFERMKQQNLYSTDVEEIYHRIKKADLYDIINHRVI